MMGRKPTKPGAVPRLRARKSASGRVYYYYDHGGKPRREEPLGADRGLALKRWADIEHESAPPAQAVVTFRHVADRYRAEVIPTKAPRTQRDNDKELTKLIEFFDDPPAPLDAIQPQNVRQYLKWRRPAIVRAAREKALLSHLWNWARGEGYTGLPNPCAGIMAPGTGGRKTYIEDDQYKAIWQHAGPCLRDAMDLAYLTGQRPADLLKMEESHLRGGVLYVRQGKTGTKVRMDVAGELAALVERIRERKRHHQVYCTRLIVSERGFPLGTHAISMRWQKACKAAGIEGLQFRDLRAKAATDKSDTVGDIRQAQRQLGHASVVTTESYVRNRRGSKVTPTR